MRSRAFWRLLAAFFVFTLLAAACGDDDTTTDPASDDSATGVDDADMDDAEDPDAEDPDAEDPDVDMIEMDDDIGDHDDGAMVDPDGHDDGATTEVEGVAIPTVAVEVFADPASGVNIHVTSTDFDVAPTAASTEAVQGQGHYHLYVDGEKVLRFYNDWIYYAGVVDGDVEIGVELSANDHSSYTVDGEVIIHTVAFTVPEHSHDEHSHDDPQPLEFAGAAPTLAVEIVDDPKSGWNAFVTLDGMTLSPERVGGDHVDGEGHLHIYANGQKLGRLYDLATHIGALPDGEVQITVGAYANDHRPYVVDGAEVSASATVTVAS